MNSLTFFYESGTDPVLLLILLFFFFLGQCSSKKPKALSFPIWLGWNLIVLFFR